MPAVLYQEAHLYVRSFLNQIAVATNLLIVFQGLLFAGVAGFSDTLSTAVNFSDAEFIVSTSSVLNLFCIVGAVSPQIVSFFSYRMLENIRIFLEHAEAFEGQTGSLSSQLKRNFMRAIRPGQVFYLYCCFCCTLSIMWVVALFDLVRRLF